MKRAERIFTIEEATKILATKVAIDSDLPNGNYKSNLQINVVRGEVDNIRVTLEDKTE